MDNSISSQVTTPITGQDLSSALINALESNTVSPVSAPNDVTFDILLAEDNLVDQKLAVKILELKSIVILLRLRKMIAWRLMPLEDGWLKISLLISFWCDGTRFFFERSLNLYFLDGRIYAFHGRYGSN